MHQTDKRNLSVKRMFDYCLAQRRGTSPCASTGYWKFCTAVVAPPLE